MSRQANAHPHMSGDIAVVHNGIIENHEALLLFFKSVVACLLHKRIPEVIAHLVEWELRTSDSLVEALQKTAKQLDGAYGTVAVDRKDPSRIVVARSGSPIVIGFGVGENFLASDQLALLSVTRRFMYLEEGDAAEVTVVDVTVFDVAGERVERDIVESNAEHDAGDKGQYRHFMQKRDL